MTTSEALVCWSCGESLAEVALPIGRLATCLTCRADLHVCRLCRHYDPHVRGQCRHERAERIVDKTLANFCTYFKAQPGAYRPGGRSASEQARAELETLFGKAAPTDSAASDAQQPRSEAEHAREALESLFGKNEPQS